MLLKCIGSLCKGSGRLPTCCQRVVITPTITKERFFDPFDFIFGYKMTFSTLLLINLLFIWVKSILGNLENLPRVSNWIPRVSKSEECCPRGANSSNKNLEETKSSK